ncbi:universal stress protein, partial [Candidatus Nitrosarchaeum limnium]
GNILLKKATEHAGNKNVKFKTKTIRGSPSIEIVKLSQSGKFDDIVMSTTGAGSATGEMLGSVSNYVVHKSKVPVYLIK